MKTHDRLRLMLMMILATVMLLLGAPAFGQDARLKINNLDKLTAKAAEVVDVMLDGPMLKLAAKFLEAEHDPEEAEVKEIIKGLKGVYVKSFEFDKEGDYSDSDVEAIRQQLKTPGWSRIVASMSKRDHENSEIYMLVDANQAIQGLAIIDAEPKELTVVNIVGPIDLDKLSALEGRMGVPKMGIERSQKPAKLAEGQNEKK